MNRWTEADTIKRLLDENETLTKQRDIFQKALEETCPKCEATCEIGNDNYERCGELAQWGYSRFIKDSIIWICDDHRGEADGYFLHTCRQYEALKKEVKP